mmetsp:Transcript_642/g.2980  ORF Transcript_642/g.2980 Transcript_642/m.2980 type:complete len:203 (+) Transcript_642:3691-4299(+)
MRREMRVEEAQLGPCTRECYPNTPLVPEHVPYSAAHGIPSHVTHKRQQLSSKEYLHLYPSSGLERHPREVHELVVSTQRREQTFHEAVHSGSFLNPHDKYIARSINSILVVVRCRPPTDDVAVVATAKQRRQHGLQVARELPAAHVPGDRADPELLLLLVFLAAGARRAVVGSTRPHTQRARGRDRVERNDRRGDGIVLRLG